MYYTKFVESQSSSFEEALYNIPSFFSLFCKFSQLVNVWTGMFVQNKFLSLRCLYNVASKFSAMWDKLNYSPASDTGLYSVYYE